MQTHDAHLQSGEGLVALTILYQALLPERINSHNQYRSCQNTERRKKNTENRYSFFSSRKKKREKGKARPFLLHARKNEVVVDATIMPVSPTPRLTHSTLPNLDTDLHLFSTNTPSSSLLLLSPSNSRSDRFLFSSHHALSAAACSTTSSVRSRIRWAFAISFAVWKMVFPQPSLKALASRTTSRSS